MKQSHIDKNSAEYAEIIADIFVDTMRKASIEAMCCEYEGEEITPSLMQTLNYVYLHGASPIREIASGLEVSLSAASQLVDRLVKRGLVTRRENESDRRLIHVDLTCAGNEAVKEMREHRYKWFASVIESMPEPARNALREGMEAFLEIALAHKDSIDRACVRCGMEHVSFCVVNKLKSERAEALEGANAGIERS